MKEIYANEVKDNVVNEFGKNWALVTARKKDGTFNMCTLSWGSIGVLWSKAVVTVYVKPIRHTDSFMFEDDYFTVTFFEEDHKKDLVLCGTKSGRDIDKIKESNLEVIQLDNGITYKDFKRVYLCRKIYQAPFVKEGFINNDEALQKYYKDEPFHNVYIGEIVKVYEK